jgi:hypothetical protein
MRSPRSVGRRSVDQSPEAESTINGTSVATSYILPETEAEPYERVTILVRPTREPSLTDRADGL